MAPNDPISGGVRTGAVNTPGLTLVSENEGVTDGRMAGASIDVQLGQISGRQVFTVSDLTGDRFERLIKAMNARTVPKLGIVDPTLGVPVSHIHVSYVGDNPRKANVEVSWGLRPSSGGGAFNNDPDDADAGPLIDIIVVLEPHESAFDIHGKVLKTPIYIQTTDTDGESIPHPPQTGRAQILMPSTTIVARRRERISPGVSKAPTFNGTVNSTILFGDLAHFWMAKVEGFTDDGGASYNVTYTFKRNIFTWLVLQVWQGKDGRPGVDVTLPPTVTPGATGNGSIYNQIYDDKELRDLGLPAWFFGVLP